MPEHKPQEVVTFKVDAALAQAIQGIPNRSAFIRAAILAALDNTCPLCLGSGMMTVQQRQHWNHFVQSHSILECKDCHALYVKPRRNSARRRQKISAGKKDKP